VNLQKGTTLLDTESFGSPANPTELGWVSVTEERVSAYLRAVGDHLPIYHETGLAPPLLGAALALGQILKQFSLPAGAIHSLQEFDTARAMEIGAGLETSAFLERQRERGGLRFLTFGANMRTPDGDTALAIKTTLLVPPPGGAGEPPERTGRTQASTLAGTQSKGPDSLLAVVSREISQQQLIDYSAVSGDDNPLHLDEEFAAGTQFGGIIAHGMLTLAFVSEMMTASLGEAWLASGSMRARFKGAAYPGDRLEAWGQPGKSEPEAQSYNVGLRSNTSGEDLITGTATVKAN
jgi:3-hydroxybutyryl-CoA dehydratase